MNSSRTVNRQKSLNRMRSLVKQSGGSLIVLTALMFPFLLSFMALSLDIGMIYDVKRRQQKAADSSAMGAGQEIWRQNAAQVIPAGKADAKKNGFDDNQGAVTVNVEYPYAYNGGNANDYVRVTISEVVPTYFARLLGPESATVRSQAVAGLVNFADGCYYVLNESSNQAFKSGGGRSCGPIAGFWSTPTTPRDIFRMAEARFASRAWESSAGITIPLHAATPAVRFLTPRRGFREFWTRLRISPFLLQRG